MCHKVTCPRCGKATWEGCGQHIEQALADVPQAERCACDQAPPSQSAGGVSGSSW